MIYIFIHFITIVKIRGRTRLSSSYVVLNLIGSTNLNDLALLIVVSIPEAAPWNMTANLRAPVVLNLKTRKAVQVIALNEEYPIRHIVFPEEVRDKMRESAFNNTEAQE